MGTTAEKGARVLQSIAEVQEGINNLGGSLTDQTPFKDFKTELDNIYDTLPKTSFQEGTDVTIENGLKGKIDFDEGKVGFGQASQESTQGYNLLQAKLPTMTNSGITITNNNNGTFTINGTNTSTSTTTFRLNQSTQSGIDNLQNYEDGTYTVDLGIQNENLGINLMQNSTWTNFISTGFNVRLKSQAITNVTNTFIYIGIKGSATLNNVNIKPMLVKGSYTESTIPPFEQYTGGQASPSPNWEQPIQCVTGEQSIVVSDGNNNSITYPISLGSNKFYKIGDYADELLYDVDEDKVYKKKVIGETTVNGTQGSFSKPSTNRFNIDGIISDYAKMDNEVTTIANSYKCYANKTTADDFNSLVANVDFGLDLSSGTYPTIRIKDTRYNDIDQYKTWLSSNAVILYYVLATPTLTELTDTTLKQQVRNWYYSQSFNGTTIIESNGDLPMIIKVRALKGE